MTLKNKLLQRAVQDNLRRLQRPSQTLDFASNDYLGLARSPALFSMIHHEIALQSSKNLFGSTGSRLLTGNTSYAEKLENHIAKFHGFETALLYNCGYMANLGLISAIANDRDVIFFDTHVHASIRDGIRLSKAAAFPFHHNDLHHLETRLKSATASKRYLCIESIYSMDGSKAPLSEICLLAKKYDAKIIIDEAHATGIFGPAGQGIVENQQKHPEIIAKVITFSKALGTHGAAVLGSNLLKKFLINFSSPQIYTTALPLHSLIAIKCAYELLPTLKAERSTLNELISLYAQNMPYASRSPIQPFYIQGNKLAKHISHLMAVRGYDVRAILSPTVQQGHEILRINLHAFNQKVELLSLIKELKSCLD